MKLPAFDTAIDGDDGDRLEVCVTYSKDSDTQEITLVSVDQYGPNDGPVEWIWEDEEQLPALLQLAYDDAHEQEIERDIEDYDAVRDHTDEG